MTILGVLLAATVVVAIRVPPVPVLSATFRSGLFMLSIATRCILLVATDWNEWGNRVVLVYFGIWLFTCNTVHWLLETLHEC